MNEKIAVLLCLSAAIIARRPGHCMLRGIERCRGQSRFPISRSLSYLGQPVLTKHIRNHESLPKGGQQSPANPQDPLGECFYGLIRVGDVLQRP